MSRLFPNVVHLALRNILTKFYPLKKELMSTAITRKLKDSLNVMKPSIKTRLPSMTPPIPRLKHLPPPVSDGTTTFTSTSSRLSKKKLWLQKLFTRLLLFMKSIIPQPRTTGPKSCLLRQWTNSLAVMVHFRVMEPTRLENLRVVQNLIAMIWRIRIRRRELVVDPKIGFSKGSFFIS